VEHRTDQSAPPNSPPLASEPLGDLVSGDAVHTNPAAAHVRTWMTVNVAAAVAAGADARASAVTA